jgi:hypothetical protein
MSDHIHMLVKLDNKFYTLIIIYTYIYIKKDVLIKNNQAVLIYQ